MLTIVVFPQETVDATNSLRELWTSLGQARLRLENLGHHRQPARNEDGCRFSLSRPALTAGSRISAAGYLNLKVFKFTGKLQKTIEGDS